MKHLTNYFFISIFFVLGLAPKESKASETVYEELIEVEQEVSLLDPYKVRRGDSGAIFNIDYVSITPKDYPSTIGNVGYEEQYGSSAMTGIEASLMWKRNWQPLSFAMGPFYQSISANKSTNDISMDTYGIAARFILDGMSDEPRWCPFVNLSLWQANINESSASDSFSGSIDVGYSWKAGLQIQIDQLDKSTAVAAYTDSGLQATFLSLSIGANGGGFSEDDPAIETQPEFGAGLTLEF